MKISKAINEILEKKELVQTLLDIDDSGEDSNQLKRMELIGKRDGLELALEILKKNI